MEHEQTQAAPEQSVSQPAQPQTSTGQTSVVTWLLITAAIIVIVVLLFGGGGYGDTRSKDFTVEHFTSIHMASGMGTLTVAVGDTPGLTVSAPEKYLEWLTATVDGDTLTVDSNRPWYQQLFFVGPKKDAVAYTLTVTDLSELIIDGAMDVETDGTLTGDTLAIQLNGAADMDFALDFDTLMFNISGAGNANLSGRADTQTLSIDGAGNINARELMGIDVSVEINGAGNAEVYSSEKLRAEIKGAGTISYAGNPSDVDQQVNGVGTIKNLETGDKMKKDDDPGNTDEESMEETSAQNETADESMMEEDINEDVKENTDERVNENANVETDNTIEEIIEETTDTI